MKPVKCPNNHYYDSEKYSECPHCAKEGLLNIYKSVKVEEPVKESRESEKKHFSLFKRNNKNREENTKNKPHTESEVFTSTDIKINVTAENGKDDDFVELPEEPAFEKTVKLEMEDVYSNSEQEKQEREDESSYQEEPVTAKDNSLTAAVKATNSAVVSQDSKTVCFFNAETETEPVVGWLVCVKGNYVGESFNLKSGRNNIGRLVSMDIALAKEPSVSRDRHAVIIFEPNRSQFIIQAGESNGLTYLNGELVVTYNELKRLDHIMLGKCELVFAPLCDESFSWNDYIHD